MQLVAPSCPEVPLHSIRFSDDQIVKRLRWVMLAVMLFSVINTLAGQPKSFWHNPETAIRGDGLSIHNQTNHVFEFFLGHGWQAYLAASLIYLLAAFLLVSLLPKRAALVTAFSFILGHFFGGSNWLAVRWHFGVEGPTVYGIVLSTILVLSVFPATETSDRITKRLRWVMIGAMLLDFAVTLAGQPSGFWSHPETMRESNQLVRLFLGRGWQAYFLFDLVVISGTFLLASILPRTIALICVFSATLGGFIGSSNWSFYDWRMGMETPVGYGIVLSIAIVALAFTAREEETERLRDSFRDNDGRQARQSIQDRLRCWQAGC
jgi:hypothetical protein